MAKITLNDIIKTYDTTLINDNFTKIENEFQNKVLYRNNPSGEPNSMLTNLDMNSNRIINLPAPVSPSEAARLQDVQALAVADLVISDEGTVLTGACNSINFVGAGVTATAVANDVTITVPAGATPSNATPAAPTVSGSAGVSTLYARGDHAHPRDGVFVQDEGVALTEAQTINFTGIGVTATNVGNVVTVNVPGGGSSIAVSDEGSSLTTGVTSFNFTGTGVTASSVGNAVTVNVPGGGGSGTVTSVSVVNANGFNGSVANATTTPAITLQTTASGVLKGASNALVAATSGTDFAPGTSALGTGILKSTTGTGALSIAVAGDFPTLNQNTTGTASNVTGVVAVANGGTGLSTTPINGQLDIGNGTGFTRSTLTAGSGINITNGAGSITIAATGGGGSSGWVLLASQTVSAVSAIDFLNVFSSTYDDYVIMIEQVATATSGVSFNLRFASGGTVDSTASYRGTLWSDSAGTVITSNQPAGTLIPLDSSAVGAVNAIVYVVGVNSGLSGGAAVQSRAQHHDSGGSSAPAYLSSYVQNNTTIKSGFRLLPGSGNFQAQGVVRVYGIVKV